MTTISSLWFMILVELLIVTTVVSIVIVTLNFMRKRRDRAAASRLIASIKAGAAHREEETKKLMQHKFGFEEDVAKEMAIKSGCEERKFYQDVINFYLRREAMSFEKLNIYFEAVVDLYRTLDPLVLGGVAAGDAEPQNETDEIRRLKIDNQRLTDEVGVTMQTMTRMLDDYSSIFAGGAANDMDEEQAIKQTQDGVDEDEWDAESELDSDVTAEAELASAEESIGEIELESKDMIAEFEVDIEDDSIVEVEQMLVDPGEIVVEELNEKISSTDDEMDDLSDLDREFG